MDVKLQNAYVEVLLGNFMEVVKQNLMFQAQLEVSKNEIAEAQSIKRKIDELAASNIQLQKTIQDQGKEIQDKAKELQDKTRQISSFNPSDNSNLKQEKDRLQAAVNDVSRQLKQAKEDVLKAKSESQDVLLQNNIRIEELTKYVERLETAVSATKLKKIKRGEDVTQSETPEESVVTLPIVEDDDVKSGGTF